MRPAVRTAPGRFHALPRFFRAVSIGVIDDRHVSAFLRENFGDRLPDAGERCHTVQTFQEGWTTIMANENGYAKTAPTRAEVDGWAGATVLEFGTDWCGYCQGAQRHIAESLGRAGALRHLKIEDGPGRPLGRSFKVKLWPTLIFLRDGVEVARVVRPTDAKAIDQGVAALA